MIKTQPSSENLDATPFLVWVKLLCCSFFGIGFEVYGNYMLWIVALVIFWSILPQEEPGKIFRNSKA